MAASTVAVNLALNGLGGVLGGLSRLSGALGGVARGAGAAVGTVLLGGAEAGAVALAGLGAIVGKTGVDFLALKEQALTAFTTMLGSSSAGQAFFNSLQQFAATTPFELPGILQAAQRLLAFGFAAKDVVPDLTAIGNAIAATGGGQAQLDRVVLALGQMRTKGKVQGDEMLQLTENNIAAWDYLAKFLHTDVATAQKMVTKGLVTGEQGINAIIQGLSRDPKFAGMMEKQSHTFTGLVSNMHDYWNQFTAAIMAPVFDKALKPGLEWLTKWLSGPGMALGTRIGQGLAAGLDRAGRAVGWLRGQFAAFRKALGSDALGTGPIAALAAGFMRVRAAITQHIIPALQLLWRTFTGGAAGKAGDALKAALGGGVVLVEKLARWFQLGVDAVVTFKQALEGNWFGGQDEGINTFVRSIGRFVQLGRDAVLTFKQALRGEWFGGQDTGINRFVRSIGRVTQLGRDAVLTFRQAFAGDWTKDGAGNDVVNLIGRIGLALGDLTRAFQRGGVGGLLTKLWSDYLQPALVNAWVGLTGWVRQKAPLIGAQLLAWGGAFKDWAGGVWAGYLWPGIQGLWAAFTGWVGDRVPDVLAQLGAWGGAFKDWAAGIWTDHLAPGIVDLWNGFAWWIAERGPDILTTLGTWGAAFGTWAGSIWTDHLGPGIAQLWKNFKSTLLGGPAGGVPIEDAVGNIIPQQGSTGLLGMFGEWLGTLPDWAKNTALPAITSALTTAFTGVQIWATSTGLPLLKQAGSAVMDALTQAFVGTPTPGIVIPGPAIEGVAGNLIPQDTGASTNGWLAKMLNDAVLQATAWVAGPGANAIGALNLAIWGLLGTKIAPAIISGLATHWEEVLAALGALIENSTVPGLVLKWAPEIGKQIGNGIWAGIKDTPFGAFLHFLTGGANDRTSTNQPTNVAGNPSGGGGPGDAEGGPAITGLGGGQPAFINMTVNYNSPLTAADVARAHAEMLLAAMRDGLGDGGGMVTA